MKRNLGKSKAYISLIHTLPCCISGMYGVSSHHIRHNTGMGMKSPDWHCIALHYDYHQGVKGIHTLGTRAWEKIYGSQLDHARKTQAILSEFIEIPEEFKL